MPEERANTGPRALRSKAISSGDSWGTVLTAARSGAGARAAGTGGGAGGAGPSNFSKTAVSDGLAWDVTTAGATMGPRDGARHLARPR